MHILIAFAVLFVIFFIAAVLLSAMAKGYSGQSTMSGTDWWTAAGIAAVAAAAGSLMFGGAFILVAMLFGW